MLGQNVGVCLVKKKKKSNSPTFPRNQPNVTSLFIAHCNWQNLAWLKNFIYFFPTLFFRDVNVNYYWITHNYPHITIGPSSSILSFPFFHLPWTTCRDFGVAPYIPNISDRWHVTCFQAAGICIHFSFISQSVDILKKRDIYFL